MQVVCIRPVYVIPPCAGCPISQNEVLKMKGAYVKRGHAPLLPTIPSVFNRSYVTFATLAP